ncbi:MAG: hypothetical protein JNL79_13050 [Myxococcales bacterium]|nr:hypothetical protein [Myxococcales bacterium]
MQVELERCQLRPGEVVRGRVQLDAEGARTELSVLWETQGKGTTDLGVIHHRELGAGEHPFEVALPRLPLTYVGTLIKVRWLVRLRRIATIGDDQVVDAEFEVAW